MKYVKFSMVLTRFPLSGLSVTLVRRRKETSAVTAAGGVTGSGVAVVSLGEGVEIIAAPKYFLFIFLFSLGDTLREAEGSLRKRGISVPGVELLGG